MTPLAALRTSRTNFLFDFDGTLVDSSPLHALAFRQVLAERMPELLPQFDYEALKGKSTRAAFAELGIRQETELDEFTFEKQRTLRAAIAEGRLVVLPGARELLTYLDTAGHRVFLVTSGSRGSVTASLEATGIGAFFTGVVTADDVERSKPAPDAFLCCVQQFALSLKACVAVEDSPNGAAAARAAGLPVIGVHNQAACGLFDLFFPSLRDLKRWAESTACERTFGR